jgi:hypothetical protein
MAFESQEREWSAPLAASVMRLYEVSMPIRDLASSRSIATKPEADAGEDLAVDLRRAGR